MKDYLEKMNKKNPMLGESIIALWHGNKRDKIMQEQTCLI